MKTFLKRIFLFVVLLMAAEVAVQAQNAPIRWRMTVKMTSATEGVATLRALIEPGWHLYGFEMPEDGPKATAISFEKSEGIKLVGALTPERKAVVTDDPVFGVKLTWWDSNIAFTQKFKLVKGKTPRLEAGISYMGCNDQTCLPPKTESLVFTQFNKK